MKLIVGILLIAFAAFVCCDSDIESSSGESSVPANGQELPQNEEDDSACSPALEVEEQLSCDGYFPRFRYNTNTNDCEEFIYGGCGGNKNNYPDEESCVTTCVKQ